MLLVHQSETKNPMKILKSALLLIAVCSTALAADPVVTKNEIDDAHHQRVVEVTLGDRTFEYRWGLDVTSANAERESKLLAVDDAKRL
jgi:hypothetical protein